MNYTDRTRDLNVHAEFYHSLFGEWNYCTIKNVIFLLIFDRMNGLSAVTFIKTRLKLFKHLILS